MAHADFCELLLWRGAIHPEAPAFSFWADGEQLSTTLNYGELLQQSRQIAAALQARQLQGARLLLLYPPGLDFIPAFLGCLLAGAIPVPAYPPEPHRLQHTLRRLHSIVADAGARGVLTDRQGLVLARSLFAQSDLARLEWCDSTQWATGPALDWQQPQIDPEGLAFIQYTSGSTARPKGVMISQRNLLSNCEMFQIAAEHAERAARLVCWVPFYHDMGLVGHLLNSLYSGGETLVMPPLAFLKRPRRWLQLISDSRATSTGAPNFAFDLCVRKIPPAERIGLDLSSLRFVLNAAEPIQAASVRRFIEAFAPCGLDPASVAPSYGLAEATVFVSSGLRTHRPWLLPVQRQAFEQGQIITENSPDSLELVACGQPRGESQLRIVQPETLTVLPEGQIGEIWIQGPHVAPGYWQQPEASAETFGAQLPGVAGTFLRSGDLGFMYQGELFVSGRRKDLIIIRGRNLYPHDLEASLDQLRPQWPAIRPGCGAAFAWETPAGEAVVCFQELTLPVEPPLPELARQLAIALSTEHDVPVAAVVLLEPGQLPKTSSGKIMRQACRQLYAQHLTGLKVLCHWQPETAAAATPPVAALADWLRDWLQIHAPLCAQPPDWDARFAEMGLNSLLAVQLAAALEQKLQRPLPDTLLFDYPTPRQLLAALSAPHRPETRPETRPDMEPIAIVGASCRLPGGVDSLDSFWELLCSGRDAIGPIPPERWPLERWYDPRKGQPGRMYIREGGFLSEIDGFEPAFFQIAPREAIGMDPQQRLLLELAWEAFEQAGLQPADWQGRDCGVFIGVSRAEYEQRHPEAIDAWSGTGVAPSVCSGRLAYWLGLRGPALTIDTACSSSLVAVHQACQSLRSGESELALAGGVNLMLSPEASIYFCQLQALAADGRCKSFDAAADGFIRSEGGGLVLLKRLSDARRDQDQILAVIAGSAVNHNGASNGLTAPSTQAQHQLITRALGTRAPEQIGFVETHGTGTALGDPIEAEALRQVFLRPERQQPLFLGALKSQLGHLEAAAGIAGLLKTVLVLRQRQIPANLHFQQLNPRIAADPRLCLPTALRPWPADQPACAGVSSLGISGTNAHLVLAAEPPSEAPDPAAAVFLLSAHSAPALLARAQQLAHWLDRQSEPVPTGRLAWTLSRRSSLPWRLALQADHLADLRQQLAAVQRAGASALTPPLPEPRLIFVFSGQGSQWVGMGRELLAADPIFAASFRRCAQALAPELEIDLLQLLQTGQAKDFARMEWLQPLLFALQIALAEHWQAAGFAPQAVLGHSMGEVAAACIAGALSLADGARVICRRSHLLARSEAGGAMLYTALSPEACQPLLAPGIEIAVCNSPESTVLSGDRQQLERVRAHLEQNGQFARFVQVPVAAHSAQIEAFAEPLQAALAELSPQRPRIPMLSSVRAEFLSAPPDSAYWYANLRQPVQFAAAARHALAQGFNLWVEISPHPLLLPAIEQNAQQAGLRVLALPSLRREQPEVRTLRAQQLTAWAAGCAQPPVTFTPTALLDLPPYPWQRSRYWLPEAAAGLSSEAPPPTHTPPARILRSDTDTEPASDLALPSPARGTDNASEPVLTGSPSAPELTPPAQAFYQFDWHPLPLPPVSARWTPGCWLLFSEHATLPVQLELFFKARGQTLLTVRTSAEARLERPPLALNPDQPEHLQALAEALRLHLRQPLHGMLWHGPATASFQPQQAEQTVLRLQSLLQSLPAFAAPAARFYALLEADLSTSPCVGLLHSAFFELPRWHPTLLRLSPNPDSEQIARLAAEILANSPESDVRLSSQKRECARIVPWHPPAQTDLHQPPPAVRELFAPAGAWLISGGLGELGLATADWLIKQGVRDLVLLSRRGCDCERRRAALAALEQQGATLTVVTCDISQAEQLAAVLADIRRQRPIRGVFHAAGILQDGLLTGQTPERLQAVLAPKVRGGWYLHALTRTDRLALFVTYGSITAPLGMPAQSNYAAANSFLEALIARRRAEGRPGLNIAWGPWARDPVLLQSLSVRPERLMLAPYGFGQLATATGFERLTTLLAAQVEQALVMGLNPPQLLEALPQARNLPLLTELIRAAGLAFVPERSTTVTAVTAPSTPAPQRPAVARPAAPELEQFLLTTISQILHLPPGALTSQQSLRNSGFDSLMALELASRLEARYGLSFQATDRFQSLSVAEICQRLLDSTD